MNFKLPIFILIICITVLNNCNEPPETIDSDTITDIDGNIYTSVVIGEQVWMVENLRVTHFQNGEPILTFPQDENWGTLYYDNTPTYCSPGYDANNIDVYGLWYNGVAIVDNRKLAPRGWHIPTLDEWNKLIEFLGGTEVAGGKLKEVGTSHWDTPNNGATNEYGFTALPAGFRQGTGNTFNIGNVCYFWILEDKLSHLTSLVMGHISVGISYGSGNALRGHSVRCIKD